MAIMLIEGPCFLTARGRVWHGICYGGGQKKLNKMNIFPLRPGPIVI